MLPHIVKNTFNQMASIKRYDDEARPSDAGGFYNAFQPASPKTTLRPDFFYLR